MTQSDFVAKGQALVNSGQYQEAVKVCRLGLLGRPTTVEGRVVLGQALLALKRYDEVLAEMRVALELDHGSFVAQMLKAEALLRKGDPHAASDILRKLQTRMPGNRAVDDLLAECDRNLGKPAISASHPSVGYLGKDSSRGFDDNTRNYPNHAFGDADEETTGGSFDRPTSVAAPSSKKRSGEKAAAQPAPLPDATPPPNVLAVGDRSGTVEVDPELEGIELESDDFGDVAAPPQARGPAGGAALERGQVTSSRRGGGQAMPGLAAARPGAKRKQPRGDVSSVELVDDDLVEVDDSVGSGETLPPVARKPGPGTRVRNAINVPSGPLDISTPASTRPTAAAPAIEPPAHLAQMIANAPHVMDVSRQHPPAGPIAAALPTMAAPLPPMPQLQAQPPAGLPHMPPAALPAAARPTLAINAPPDPQPWARGAQPVAAPYGQPQHPPYGSPHAEEPTVTPQPIDPQLAAMLDMISPAPATPVVEPSQASARALKTGMRKGRSKLQIAIWLLIGAAVIAGGVIVGFKFRSMRLDKKIADTLAIAQGLAKADTWKGMVRARDRFAGVAQAAPTADNKAALARMRALIAFEFGEGVPEAKTAIDGLAGEGGFDAEIAAAYYALAVNDAKAALEASGRALKTSPDDAAALYVSGQAELLAGDLAAGIKQLQAAVDKEGRPLYRIALSRAHLEATEWKEASRAIDQATIKAWYDALDVDTARELKDSGIQLSALIDEHPGVITQRARIAVATGQVVGTKVGELHGQLERIVAEGAKGINDQPRGVSLVQVGFTYLAMSEVDFAGNKQGNAAMKAALDLNVEDQRFAEQVTETLFSTLDFGRAAAAGERVLKGWAGSRRARVTLAQLALQQGHPQEALDWLAKVENGDKLAVPLTVRGRAKLALGDLVGAKDDLDRAYERSGKKLEPALVARTWVDLAAGEIDAARNRIKARYEALGNQKITSPAVITAWAAILRSSGAADDIKAAKDILEPLSIGSPGLDIARAQLELARLARDTGDEMAKSLYTKVITQTNSRAVRVETARYLIDFSDPNGGREMFDELLKGNVAEPPELLVEAARAHMLVGDHAGAAELLDRADKQDAKTWRYDRERGRLALRKGDYPGAALLLSKVLDHSGDDVETMFLAAEVAAADAAKFKDLIEKLKSVAKARLKPGPASLILTGKLVPKGEDAPKDALKDAKKAFDAATDAMQKAAPPRLRAQAALGLGIVAYNNQDDPVALDAFAFAIRFDPTLYEAYIYVADIQLGRKENAKALESAQSAVKFNPDNVDAYVMVGRAAHGLGKRQLLAEMMTKVGALAPNSDQLKALQALR